MALTYSEKVELGTAAPVFTLRGTDDLQHSLTDFRYAKVLVVAFICNHCPYVKAVKERLKALSECYRGKAVQIVGINSNDSERYPEDSFEAMKGEGYGFPYLWDQTQAVARAYGAVCTPDFFVFEQVRPEDFREADEETAHDRYRDAFRLRYRGRLDDSWKDEGAVKSRDLAAAIDALLAGKSVASQQLPSMGCSIKWTADKIPDSQAS